MKLEIKKDRNGNKTLSVKTLENRAFSIQTNGNLPETHRDGITQGTGKELINYLLETKEIAKLSLIVLEHSNWTGLSLAFLMRVERISKDDLKAISSFVYACLGDPKSIDEYRVFLMVVKYISK